MFYLPPEWSLGVEILFGTEMEKYIQFTAQSYQKYA